MYVVVYAYAGVHIYIYIYSMYICMHVCICYLLHLGSIHANYSLSLHPLGQPHSRSLSLFRIYVLGSQPLDPLPVPPLLSRPDIPSLLGGETLPGKFVRVVQRVIRPLMHRYVLMKEEKEEKEERMKEIVREQDERTKEK